MRTYPVTALVLRKTKLGETDTILTLLAEDGTSVRAVAKGLRKPGSRFGARLEPYAVVDLLLHSGKSLETVTDARTVETNSALREDYDRSLAAAVVADLLDKIAVEGQSEPRLFALATTTLGVLARCDTDALDAVVVAFLIKAMAMHGYRPELESCAHCGCDADASAVFSLSHGGALCPACGDLDPSALRAPDETRRWLGALLGSRLAELADAPPPPVAVADCLILVRSFIAFHLATRLKALDMYVNAGR